MRDTMKKNSSCDIRFEGCGQVIRKLRKDAELTVRQFAEIAGCEKDSGRITKIEKNEVSVSLNMIVEIAAGLEVPYEKIVVQCLEARFPKMRTTEAGKIVAEFLS